MQYLRIKNLLTNLLSEANYWENSDLLAIDNDESRRKSSKLASKKRILLYLISILIVYLIKMELTDAIIGYITTSLSIYIGLFTSLIIVMYGRNDTIKLPNEESSTLEKLNYRKMKNFIRQFTFITGKNLIIATLIISILFLILLMDIKFIGFQSLYGNISMIKMLSIIENVKKTVALITQIILIYLGINFFLLLLYSLGALFAFLKLEYSE